MNRKIALQQTYDLFTACVEIMESSLTYTFELEKFPHASQYEHRALRCLSPRYFEYFKSSVCNMMYTNKSGNKYTYGCPCCEYALPDMLGSEEHCVNCPLIKLWRETATTTSKKCPCCNEGTPFYALRDAEDIQTAITACRQIAAAAKSELEEKPMFADAKVGDKVWSITEGWGTVFDIKESGAYPVKVKFEHGGPNSFTYAGRWLNGDFNPTLFWDEITIQPPPRPKRVVVKELHGWVNVYPPGYVHCFHLSKEQADKDKAQNRIACVEVHGTYEVEE